MRSPKSLKHQLFLVYILIMLLFSLALSSYIYISNRSYAQEKLIDHYQNTAASLVNDMEAELDALGTYSYILSRNPSLLRILLNPYDIYDTVVALNADIEPVIQFILNSNDRVENVTIYTDQQQHRIPSPYFEDVSTVSDSLWFQNISDLDGSHVFAEGNTLYIVTPIRNYHSQKIDTGFVKMDIDMASLAGNILSKHEDIHFSISDHSGNPIYSTLALPASDHYLALSPISLRSTSASATFYVDQSLMQISIGSMLLPILLILIFSLLLTYIFIQYTNRKIFSRLEQIKDKIGHMDADHFIITIDDQPNDEIGALSTCINKMSVKIDTMFAELDATKTREKQAEMEALRSRIDPHFLYNMLNTINWIALDGNIDLVCSLTQELAVYYRTTLNGGEPVSTVKNEIENIQAYLNLQKIATDHAFDITYQLDESLMDCKVCDFILQPLVENAITHGIKPLKGRRGHICVKLYTQDQDLYFAVTDNGIGLEHSASGKGSALKKHHYGIRNINLRIALAFGSDYGVTLSPGPEHIGTTATIHLPKHPYTDA